MILTSCRVTANETVGPNIYVLGFHFTQIASKIEAGQFINIKVNELSFPLLRRPFSIYHVEGEEVKIIFDVRGIGTSLLSRKRPGDFLDILGPLGCAYNVDDDYDTALLVGGGLGIAPLPMVALAICRRDRNVITFLGARTRAHLIRSFLPNVRVATDDGSEGFHGTVVDLLG